MTVQVQMAAVREVTRAATARRHDPERVLAAVRLARLVDAEEGDVRSVGRPGDEPARAREPRQLRRLSATRAHDVHGLAALEVGALAAIGAERDALAVGRPGEALDRPVAARQAARAGTGPRVLDEQVRVPVEVAVSVVAPVGAGDHARERRGARRQRADGEARRPDRPTASASRLPRGDCAKALTPCGSAVSCSASPPSSGTAQTCSSRRKSTRSPCGVSLRRGVAHVARGERARAAAVQRHEPRRGAGSPGSARCGACTARGFRRG